MIEQDTIRLLRECDAGIKMGITSIDDVLPYVSSPDLKQNLSACKNSHTALKSEIQTLLDNQRQTRARRIRQHDCRSYDRRLQYGHKIAAQISKRIQSSRRSFQRHCKKTRQPGRKPCNKCKKIFIKQSFESSHTPPMRF